MECLECGQTYSTDSMATAKQCSGCARIEALEAENAALREALAAIAGVVPWPDPDMGFNDLARAALARQTEGEQ